VTFLTAEDAESAEVCDGEAFWKGFCGLSFSAPSAVRKRETVQLLTGIWRYRGGGDSIRNELRS